MIDFQIPNLRTEPLILPDPKAKSFENVVAFFGDKECSWGFGAPLDRREAWRWFALMIGQWGLLGFWPVETVDRQPVGMVGIWNPECQSAFNGDPLSASEYDPPPGGWDRWGGVRDPLLLSEVETTAQPHLFYADHPRLPFHRCTTKRSFCNQTRWVKLDADFPPSGSSLQAFPHPEGWPEPKLGWVMFAGSEGRGYADEAAKEARRYTYNVPGIEPLNSNIFPGNDCSNALAERSGARYERSYENVSHSTDLVYRRPGPDQTIGAIR